MTWKRLSQHIVAQKIDNEIVVVDVRTGVYHSITGSGILIWDAIDRRHSRDYILRLLDQAYESPPETFDLALTQFIDQLVAYDLIEPVKPTSTPEDLPRYGHGAVRRPFTAATVVKYLSTDETFRKKAKFFTWQPAPDVVARKFGDDVIVIHTRKRITSKLMGCGAVIWQSIERKLHRGQIVASVLSRYDTNIEIASREVDALILTLATAALIQPKDADVVMDKTSITESGRPATRKPFESAAMVISRDTEEAVRLEPIVDFDFDDTDHRLGVARITVDPLVATITPLRLGQIALTFDDGPHPVFTPLILDILDRSSIRANFFLVGAEAEKYPHLVKEICSRGHVVGSHSHDHADLTTLDLVSAQENIVRGHDTIQRLSGTSTPFFRFPYLSYSQTLEAFVNSQGLLHFLCDINPKDWRATQADLVVDSVSAGFDARCAGIVILHEIELATEALPRIIEMLAPKAQFAYFDWIE